MHASPPDQLPLRRARRAASPSEYWNRLRTIAFFSWFEIKKINSQNILGVWWSIITPLVQCAMFIFVFLIALHVSFEKAPGVPGTQADYLVFMLSGLVPWLLLTSVINAGANMISQYANFIRQPNFPYAIIPTVIYILAIPAHLVGLFLLFGAIGFTQGGILSVNLTWLALSYILSFLMLRGIGTAIGFASMHVPDVRQFATLLLSVLIYFSPVFYNPVQLPHSFRLLVLLNPFSYYLSTFRYAFISEDYVSVISPTYDLLVMVSVAVIVWWLQARLLLLIRSQGIDSVI